MTAQRVPLAASCAEELAALQCAALSCIGALLTAYACLQLPAARTSRFETQGESALRDLTRNRFPLALTSGTVRQHQGLGVHWHCKRNGACSMQCSPHFTCILPLTSAAS